MESQFAKGGSVTDDEGEGVEVEGRGRTKVSTSDLDIQISTAPITYIILHIPSSVANACFLSNALGVYAIRTLPSTGSGYTRPVSRSRTTAHWESMRGNLEQRLLNSRPEVQRWKGRTK